MVQAYIELEEILADPGEDKTEMFSKLSAKIKEILAIPVNVPAEAIIHSALTVLARFHIMQPEKRNTIEKFIETTQYQIQFQAALASSIADPFLDGFLTDTIGPNMKDILFDEPIHVIKCLDTLFNHCSITDAVDKLQIKFAHFTEPNNEEAQEEMYTAALFGSVQCFLFLWLNRVRPDDKYIVVAAVIGGNTRILHDLMNNEPYNTFSDYESMLTAAVHARRDTIVDWLLDISDEVIEIENAVYGFNITTLATLKFTDIYRLTMFNNSISCCNIPAAVMSGLMDTPPQSLDYSYAFHMFNQLGPDLAKTILDHFDFDINEFSVQLSIDGVKYEHQAAFIEWFYPTHNIFEQTYSGETILNTLLSPKCSVEAFKAAIQISQTKDAQKFLEIMNRQKSEGSVILKAAEVASQEKINILFNNGADPNVRGPDGQSFLFHLFRAHRNDKAKIAVYYLTRFAGSLTQPGDYRIILKYILAQGTVELFKQYVDMFHIDLKEDRIQNILENAKNLYNNSITRYLVANKII